LRLKEQKLRFNDLDMKSLVVEMEGKKHDPPNEFGNDAE
jgi:hypothetical protein